MLWNASNLIGYTIDATDGAIGSVDDFLFDDREWTIRWLVVDTGTWLSGRKVLLPPKAVAEPEMPHRAFPANVTKQQVKDSPEIDTDAPVSRHHENNLYGHYGWEPYWVGYPPVGAGLTILPRPVETPPIAGEEETDEGDPHLCSTEEVTGYYIQAKDGDIGHIEEFLIDLDNWTIRYLVVDTRNWWPGKKVLVAPRAVTSVDWAKEMVDVNLTRDQVKNAPEYDPTQAVDRLYEERYHGYYGYPRYW
ncbi:hypothetical protein ATN84_11140 [Paramesorhizobium deserti]|uniref:PRC-barrel domain-containing protein n=1 Tax=Paramesorhizobium deserti TaxID=1494590 RepID=A0A135HTS8_9HYPH|nr:PRC-barrel domain-containing protein [Paramesorhizobium deserti]KXF76605.1 hypothetical protein ATN84_11140 [Paramesorhizobium deserti]